MVCIQQHQIKLPGAPTYPAVLSEALTYLSSQGAVYGFVMGMERKK